MHHTARKTIIALLALLGLSACSPAGGSQTAWENVHGGLLIENIYTGEDHI